MADTKTYKFASPKGAYIGNQFSQIWGGGGETRRIMELGMERMEKKKERTKKRGLDDVIRHNGLFICVTIDNQRRNGEGLIGWPRMMAACEAPCHYIDGPDRQPTDSSMWIGTGKEKK